MPIPSVVIEPASSNEGDDDRDGDIISPVAAISDNGVMATEAKVSGAAAGGHGLPDGFLYKVRTTVQNLLKLYKTLLELSRPLSYHTIKLQNLLVLIEPSSFLNGHKHPTT